jgi:hypothetical protein
MTTIDQRPTHVWGDGVRALRGIYGFTAKQLAWMAFVDEEVVERLEAGGHGVSPQVRQAIADALHVPESQLFWEEGATVLHFPTIPTEG